jgi:hypothetical protein
MRVSRIGIALSVCLFVLASSAPSFAKDKTKPAAGSSAKEATPPKEAINACGCYRDARGGCVCTDKKGKCDCAGDCEPVGCDEKRNKELEREMAAEIKRAQEDEKKRKAALEAQENGTAAAPDGGETPSPPVKPAKSRKDASGKSAKPEKK